MSCVTCHMSRVTGHVSRVTCHVSPVKCQKKKYIYIYIFFYVKKLDKLVELAGGASVINGATPSSLRCQAQFPALILRHSCFGHEEPNIRAYLTQISTNIKRTSFDGVGVRTGEI